MKCEGSCPGCAGARSKTLLESGVEGHEEYEPPPSREAAPDREAEKRKLAALLEAEAVGSLSHIPQLRVSVWAYLCSNFQCA